MRQGESSLSRELRIGDYVINDSTDALVIAEVGSNHGGSVETCKEMFRAARAAGCQAVKLQKRDMATWEAANPELWHSAYNSEHSYGATYGEHRAALEFNEDQYLDLQVYAESLGILFFATAFDVRSVHFLRDLGVPAIKIASGTIVDRETLDEASVMDIPLIISTGGATPQEIAAAAWHMTDLDAEIALLHCTSLYPCPPEHLNLNVIPEMRRNFPTTVVGFSDHQDGIDMAPVAYALGARIFEKHFCLDHTAKGSDQAMSLEPAGMERYVRGIRRARLALGDGIKRRIEGEAAALIKQGRRDLQEAV